MNASLFNYEHLEPFASTPNKQW